MTFFYRLQASAAEIASRFGAAVGRDPWSGGSIARGQFAPVITAARDAIAGPRPSELPRRLQPRLWGVPPPPSASQTGPAVFTVRNPDSPFWIGNLRNCEFRCLVPATAFLSWGSVDQESGKRSPCWISCSDQPLFAMAGVWKDSEVPSFALLTCDAGSALRGAGIERMPVILPPDPATARLWLHGEWDGAAKLLAPYASGMTSIV